MSFLLPKDLVVSWQKQSKGGVTGAVDASESPEKAEKSSNNEDPKEELFSFTEAEERRVVRKIDAKVLPILTILYLLSFLDRSNIGNARIEGLLTDLKIKNYTTVVVLYFVGYVLFEIPANFVLKVTNPPFWLPTLTLVWGIISVCMGLVHNEAGILAARFFLGVAEAGLFPGTVYVFSRYYKRNERTTRVAFFFSAAAASGAFGGILAYGISFMRGVGGKNGWAWIFIIEGLLTIVVSLLAYYIVPNYPHLSTHFTEREKQIIEARLRLDSDALDIEGFQWSEVKRAMTTPFVYGYCALFHGFSFGLYTLSTFLPLIISGLGYKSWQAQLLSTPPYVFAFIVTMSAAYATYKVQVRAPFIIASAFVAIIGYIVLITSKTVGGKYVATFLCAAGIYSGNAVLLAWPSENCMGQTFRATVLAMQITLGNIGAIIGVNLYRIPLGGVKNTNYRISYGLTITWLGFAIIAAVVMYVGLTAANRKTLAARAENQNNEQTDDSTSIEKGKNGQWKRDFLYQT